MPRDAAGRARVTEWMFAALNSVEQYVGNLVEIDIFCPDEEWAKLRRSAAEAAVARRLEQLAAALGDREWLAGSFSAGDILMVTVLRDLRHTDLVARWQHLAAYVGRGEARPAFGRALRAQLAAFERYAPPQGRRHRQVQCTLTGENSFCRATMNAFWRSATKARHSPSAAWMA